MDVAALAGVSQSTASLALRGLDGVKPTTRERVVQAAKKLGFTLSKSASSLASGKSMRIPLLFTPSFNTWFNANLLQGAYQMLHDVGYDLIPNPVSDEKALAEFFTTLRGGKNADGAIVSSFDLNDDFRQLLKRLDIPVVGANTPSAKGFDAHVGIDDIAAMADAVTFLHSQGHRHIAFVETPDTSSVSHSSTLRAQGFEQKAAKLGYQRSSISIIHQHGLCHCASLRECASHVVASLLSILPHPTGICVETDDFAIPLVRKLRSQGVRIPQDMSVIGFDDTDTAAVADISTIHQDPVALGRLASQTLLHLIEHQPLPTTSQTLQTSLVLRSTTMFTAN